MNTAITSEKPKTDILLVSAPPPQKANTALHLAENETDSDGPKEQNEPAAGNEVPNTLTNNKKNVFISFPFFLFFYFLIGGSENNWNYIEYRNAFEWLTNEHTNFEVIFTRCMVFFRDNGLTIEDLFIFLNTISILLLYIAAYKILKGNTWLFFLLLLLFPGLNERSAMRTFVAMGFITLAIVCLSHYKPINIIISFILLYIASGLHSVAYIYFLFLLIPLMLKKISSFNSLLKNIIIILLIYLVLFPLLSIYFMSFSRQFFEDILDFEKKTVYLETRGNLGFLIYTSIQVSFTYLMYVLRKDCIRQKVAFETSTITLAEYSIIFSVLLLFLIPFYKLNNSYFRLYYCVIPTIYILCIRMIDLLKDMKSPRVTYYYSILIMSTFFLLFLYSSREYYTLNVVSLFTENYFLDLFNSFVTI